MIELSRRQCLAGMVVLPLAGGVARAETVGQIQRLDPELDRVHDVNTPIEVIATGIQWAEGPVWVRSGGYLLFSDPPANIAYRWKQGEGKTVFLKPSGLAGSIPAGVREAGSNGMVLDGQGRLVMADSGTRAIARIDLRTKRKTVLADHYNGKRFNSCNDLVIARSGAIYFTDPPYGLTDGDTSALKEQPHNGVYRWTPDGKVVLIDASLTRPNGIGLSPDERTLYVSNSDEARPEVLAWTLNANGLPVAGGLRLFCDQRAGVAAKLPGLPDGMKVARTGHLFSSGPGGIHILAADGRRLGVINTGKAAANCVFGEDGRTLFVTSSDMVVRLRLKIAG